MTKYIKLTCNQFLIRNRFYLKLLNEKHFVVCKIHVMKYGLRIKANPTKPAYNCVFDLQYIDKYNARVRSARRGNTRPKLRAKSLAVDLSELLLKLMRNVVDVIVFLIYLLLIRVPLPKNFMMLLLRSLSSIIIIVI